jgi:hypothetical protein
VICSAFKSTRLIQTKPNARHAERDGYPIAITFRVISALRSINLAGNVVSSALDGIPLSPVPEATYGKSLAVREMK